MKKANEPGPPRQPNIRGPAAWTDSCDREFDCEEALEPAFQALVEQAERAGWTATEITIALQSLADHHMLALAANAETDAQIARAIETCWRRRP